MLTLMTTDWEDKLIQPQQDMLELDSDVDRSVMLFPQTLSLILSPLTMPVFSVLPLWPSLSLDSCSDDYISQKIFGYKVNYQLRM